jgi:hypothetical protein
MVVGALIVAHQPRNAKGWTFWAIALLAFTGELAAEYAIRCGSVRRNSDNRAE